MSNVLKKRIKKHGLPPGTLVQINESIGKKAKISIIEYDPNKIRYKENATIEDCLEFVSHPSITWINICGNPDTKLIGSLGKKLGFHPLMLEDIMHTGQRTKIDNYKDSLFVVLRTLKYCHQAQSIKDEQVSFILGPNYVISFLESSPEVFNPILHQLKVINSRIRKRGADFLCYSLIDCIVDLYFLVLEEVDERLDSLEEELITHPSPQTLKKIQQKKREITSLRKSIWPLRELIKKFQRIDSVLVKETTKLYMQDIYDHTIQAIEIIDSFRDISNGLLDMYMSTMSQKMNEIMKVLTIVATIFVPLTFIASVYGMNFKHMPEIDWDGGYYLVLGVMISTALIMIAYFKRKNWI